MRLTTAALLFGALSSCASPAEEERALDHPRLDPPGQFVTKDLIWGPTTGAFKEPMGVHFDSEERVLYVADMKNSVVRVFDEAGDSVSSVGDPSVLLNPKVVHSAASGELFVLDSEHDLIKAFDQSGQTSEPLSFPSPADGPPLERIRTFTVDRLGAWYLADAEQPRVLVYDADRQLRHVLPHGGAAASFEAVTGLAVSDDGLLAVLDFEATPVQVFDRDGRLVGGFGGRDYGITDFTMPVAASFDREGRLYVVDMLRHDVKVFDIDGHFHTRFGGWFAESSGREPGELLYPAGISIAPGGTIYISERYGNRVQVFESLPVEATREVGS